MRWDDVLRALQVATAADSVLSVLYGDNIQLGGDTDYVTPVIITRLISDTVVESREPCTVQFDQWSESVSDLSEGERALRALFDLPQPTIIGGVYMDAYYLDGSELGTVSMGPDRGNLYGRAIRFRLAPVRESLRAGR